jgi:protein involved in polysaccharide export with SLBB domain
VLGLLSGCATGRPYVDRSLLNDRLPERSQAVADRYTVGCPDVLAVAVADRPDLSVQERVGPDGRIAVGALGRLRVEGRTPPEVAGAVAELAGVPPAQVSVQVAEFHSQQLYLCGQGIGMQRAVPYQGEETVLDLLQRIGGIKPGAAPEDLYVVRSRLAVGERPEVFHVDLHAILMKHDERSNVRLQPCDEICVGEMRRSYLKKCVPPWLRPLYEALCGMKPESGAAR